jgi:hypothetical protein
MATNDLLVAGGQIKTFALSNEIKINKELHTSMTHSPARLPQAFVSGRFLVHKLFNIVKHEFLSQGINVIQFIILIVTGRQVKISFLSSSIF